MQVQDPLTPEIGDYVKPRYNKDKFIEIFIKHNNINTDVIKSIYNNLIERNYYINNFNIKYNDLCYCYVDEESLGWGVPIQCLKRVKV